MNVLDLLCSNGFIVVNKSLVKAIGLYEALLLGDLISKRNYWIDRGELGEDGYFYCEAESFEDETSLSPKQQKKVFDHLEEIGFIKTSLRGIPRAKYFYICDDTITQYVQKVPSNNRQKCQAITAKSAVMDTPKVPTNNIKEITLNNNIVQETELPNDTTSLSENGPNKRTRSVGGGADLDKLESLRPLFNSDTEFEMCKEEARQYSLNHGGEGKPFDIYNILKKESSRATSQACVSKKMEANRKNSTKIKRSRME